ncbi:DUF6711 family protein [Alkaliphilus sp. B6464]|uniref:DUF6711 family protein n=1 Tax=Alkaliphilus sp. B6464 TaxID=2731219 RepID=UPI001BADB10E|nr:DUF6711 family protein [Alkaliphilus sp. B6464]QUH21073.1 hypothetical protein HYG84_15095 [Alkaliphilus sp. B6464]
MSLININGVDLPAPTKFKIQKSDLDSSDTNRNEIGILQRDRVRQGIYKIELEFNGKTSSEIHVIESAIEPAKIQVNFPSPTGKTTKTMYAGDRNGPEIAKYDEDYNKIRWNISFNLIEY